MVRCEECGSDNVAPQRRFGVDILVCGLCGALSGAAGAVTHVLMVEEAEAKGIDPAIYPLLRALDRMPGLRVASSNAGDPDGRTWPFVQLAAGDAKAALLGLENLVKSLALSAPGHDIHWIVEVDYRSTLVFTLKPRFHRDPARIGPDLILLARRDLERVRRNLERDMLLSWWRRV